jgi:hypothetical protein
LCGNIAHQLVRYRNLFKEFICNTNDGGKKNVGQHTYEVIASNLLSRFIQK